MPENKENIEVEVPKRLRDNLYDRINVSVKTMDRVIAVLVVLLIIAIVAGIILR